MRKTLGIITTVVTTGTTLFIYFIHEGRKIRKAEAVQKRERLKERVGL